MRGTDNILLLDPAALAELGNAEVVARRVVEGMVTGTHRSPFRGASVEFAEHRLYTPGDDIRSIDWRAYAKSDRHYIKEYEAQTNLAATIVVDASGSMGFGLSTLSKFRYAQIAAACLTRLLIKQRDAAGLAIAAGANSTYLTPRATPTQLSHVVDRLSKTHPGGDGTVAATLRAMGPRLRRRGFVVLISDCFEPLEPLIDAMHGLAARKQDLMLLHVMAPEELSFTFSKWSRFRCLENVLPTRNLDPRAVRKRYLERVGRFLDDLKHACGRIGCLYAPVSTDQPIGAMLGHYLRLRAALPTHRR